MDVQKDHVLHSESGKFGDGTSKPGDVVRILDQAIAENHANGVLIHFHGGLVSQKAGREIADRMVSLYASADTYPIFFVWESGLIESIQNNLQDIREDKAFQELTKKVSEWVLKKIGGQIGVAGLRGGPGQTVDERALRTEYDAWFAGQRPSPPVPEKDAPTPTPAVKGAADLDEDRLAEDIESELDNDPDFQDAIARLHSASFGTKAATRGAGAAPPAERVLVDERALREMFPEQTATTKGLLVWITVAKFVAKVVLAVIGRYANSRAHGMYCTVVEEVLRAAYLGKAGTVVWNQMKSDTAESFQDDPACCGTATVNALAKLDAAGKRFPRITLVGHSTGTIYICHFLDAAAKRLPNAQFNVIFLAPAVTYAMFAETLGRNAARIRDFRMFAMTDDLESNDVLVPIAYTRSLLYFVSGVLEGVARGDAWAEEIDAPLVGMRRYLDEETVFTTVEFPAVEAGRRFLSGAPDRTVWSESLVGDGLKSSAKKHGDFDNDESTVASVLWVLQHGF
jgi:hypothetical protein